MRQLLTGTFLLFFQSVIFMNVHNSTLLHLCNFVSMWFSGFILYFSYISLALFYSTYFTFTFLCCCFFLSSKTVCVWCAVLCFCPDMDLTAAVWWKPSKDFRSEQRHRSRKAKVSCCFLHPFLLHFLFCVISLLSHTIYLYLHSDTYCIVELLFIGFTTLTCPCLSLCCVCPIPTT